MAQGIDWKQKKASTIQDTIFPKGLLEKSLFRPKIKGNVQQISDKGEGYHTNNPFKLVPEYSKRPPSNEAEKDISLASVGTSR